jgi:hypothetical protein
MKHLFAALLLASFTAGILRGQDVGPAEIAGETKTTNLVSVDKTSTGATVLLVNYPWRVHDKASIEVRLVTDKRDFAARVKPLRFAAIRFDDESTHRILRTFDESVERPSELKLESAGLQWQVIGHSNHLGRAAEWFVHTPPKNSSVIGTTAVFFPPDPWGMGDRLLMLDLPQMAFAESGKLYVWFLRGDRILWQEDLMWPGQK